MVWDGWNREHMRRHQVKVSEVEEAYKAKFKKIKTKMGRTMIFGQTPSGRLLTIVLSYGKQGRPYVVSARDMSRKERGRYLYE